jgi:hypothetical protein
MLWLHYRVKCAVQRALADFDRILHTHVDNSSPMFKYLLSHTHGQFLHNKLKYSMYNYWAIYTTWNSDDDVKTIMHGQRGSRFFKLFFFWFSISYSLQLMGKTILRLK